jgi:hypothetical protein
LDPLSFFPIFFAAFADYDFISSTIYSAAHSQAMCTRFRFSVAIRHCFCCILLPAADDCAPINWREYAFPLHRRHELRVFYECIHLPHFSAANALIYGAKRWFLINPAQAM